VDQLNFEKLGIPTVTLVSSDFVNLAMSTWQGAGVPAMAYVTVQHPFGGISLDAIRAKTDAVFPKIMEAALKWKPEVTALPLAKAAYPAERIKFKGTVEDVNKMFFERGWSLGIPIIPPTPERVAELQKGTTRPPDEVLWKVPPRGGVLTVELLAANAAMAGCKPEVMPLLITTIEAMADPKYDWRGATTTTGQAVPMVFVSGPVVKQLGIPSSTGAGGPGFLPNTCVGYTINLIGDISGGSNAPDTDRSVLGSGSNFVAQVIGENEDVLPAGWKPYRMERGYEQGDSVVTVKNVVSLKDIHDGRSKTGKEFLTLLSAVFGTKYDGKYSIFLILGEDDTRLLARDGWTIQSIKEFLMKNTTIPYSKYAPSVVSVPKELQPAGPDTQIPLFRTPNDIQIFVSGGSGPHSAYVTWEHGDVVSKIIQK
jgi:hypothetical protein